MVDLKKGNANILVSLKLKSLKKHLGGSKSQAFKQK
jgi:hypothetical protein